MEERTRLEHRVLDLTTGSRRPRTTACGRPWRTHHWIYRPDRRNSEHRSTKALRRLLYLRKTSGRCRHSQAQETRNLLPPESQRNSARHLPGVTHANRFAALLLVSAIPAPTSYSLTIIARSPTKKNVRLRWTSLQFHTAISRRPGPMREALSHTRLEKTRTPQMVSLI